jgi:hypothetical protein
VIKVFYRAVGQHEPPVHDVINMVAVPRVGDSIEFGSEDGDGRTFEVHRVVWTPEAEEYDVYLILEA